MDEQMAAAGILMLATTEGEGTKKLQHSDEMYDSKQGKLRRRRTRSLFRMVVDVPAKHFGLDIPGFYYRGRVARKMTKKSTSMVIRFDDDGSEYWFPIPNIREWLENPRYSNGEGTVSKGADEYAASVLLDMRALKKKEARLMLVEMRNKLKRRKS